MTENKKLPKIKNDPKSKMTQNQKWPKLKNDPKSIMTQNQKWPKIKNNPKSKMTQNQKRPKIQGVFFNWYPPKNHKFFSVSKMFRTFKLVPP